MRLPWLEKELSCNSIPAKNVQTESNHARTSDKTNWRMFYKTTGLYLSKTSMSWKTQKGRHRKTDTELNPDHSGITVKNLTETIWIRAVPDLYGTNITSPEVDTYTDTCMNKNVLVLRKYPEAFTERGQVVHNRLSNGPGNNDGANVHNCSLVVQETIRVTLL